jgi:hypothetical protein
MQPGVTGRWGWVYEMMLLTNCRVAKGRVVSATWALSKGCLKT